MTIEDAYIVVKDFLENKPACREAIGRLKAGTEIGIILDEQLDLTVTATDTGPLVERKKNQNADFLFFFNPQGVRKISNHPGDNLADIGIDLVKEVIIGNVRIIFVSNIWQVMQRGYVNIILHAGAPFMQFLAQYGFGNVKKIMGYIKSIRQ